MTITTTPTNKDSYSLQPKGWLKYFSFSLDHKVIGIQYLVSGFKTNALIPQIKTKVSSMVLTLSTSTNQST